MRTFSSVSAFILLIFMMMTTASAQDKPAWKLYDIAGKPARYSKLLKLAAASDVVLFGELHNNPISHWLELEILKDLASMNDNMVSAGSEIFETDQQQILQDWLSGKITDEVYTDSMRLWPNYKTDYKMILDWAKANNIPFYATNIKRAYASKVSKEGQKYLETLTDEQKKEIPELPFTIDYELPSYQAMLEMFKGHGMEMGASNFIDAQASKDATMAWWILQYKEPGKVFYHFNGAYHSDSKEGIAWYLKHWQPQLKVMNITTRVVDDINKFQEEDKGVADYVIYVPATMPGSY